MRCLVTGASGFLGSCLVRKLVGKGHTVTALLRPGSPRWRLEDCHRQLRVVAGSLEQQGALESALREEPIDVCFHLAWAGVRGESRNAPEQITKNVPGTLNLWQIVQENGCNIFIGVGSQAEYGPQNGILHEDLAPHPNTIYGSAKLGLSYLLGPLCAVRGMRFVWLRLLSAYGPADDEYHMLPCLIRALLRRQKPALTAGEQIWDYLYVEDVASALYAAMDSEAAGVFNLGSGQVCRLRDFVLAVRDEIDSSLPLGFGEVPYRIDQVMRLEADITRLVAATGWLPQVDLKEGIRRTVAWYRTGAADAK